MFVRSLVWISVFSLLSATSSGRAAQDAPPAPCSRPEYRQFDFWIGTWQVTRADGGIAGTNRIETVAGGCGLEEQWTSASGGSGRSLNAYVPHDNKWHQVWLGSDGFFMHLTGEFRDGVMTLRGETKRADGQTVVQQIAWTPLADKTVRQVWRQSTDRRKNWTTAFDGLYRKR